MVGLTIPDGYAYVILGVTLTGLVSLVAFLFKTQQKQSEAQAATAASLATAAAELREFKTSTHQRLERLEAWHDGFQYGRVSATEGRTT